MPKSKRNTKVNLSKVVKATKERKEKLLNQIRLAVEEYDNVFVWEEHNMRNNTMKDLKCKEWAHSKFFYGKVKLMALALGKTRALETRKNLHKLVPHLTGHVGLLFTNKDKTEVKAFFEEFSAFHYATSGETATEPVVLEAGILDQFPHSIEPHLRELGMPVKLNKGSVELMKQYTVCTEGELLRPNQCRILKLLGYQMSKFTIKLKCCCSKDGKFEAL